MTIDTGALRKFQDLWGPVLQAIPAVLDMAEREADLDRALNLKRTEFEKAQKDIDAALEEANRRLSALNDEMTAVMQQSANTQQEAKELLIKARTTAAAEEQKKQAQLDALQSTIASVQDHLAGLQGEYAAKRAELDKQHADVVAGMQAEIDDLNARKAAAEQALEAIKAKLG